MLSAWRLLGVGNPVCSFPFHQRVGRAARQQPCQLSSLLTPGKTGRPKFLRTVVPTTGEGPVGSLSPAYWAKGSSLPTDWPEKVLGLGGIRCCGSGLCSPSEQCSFSRLALGASGSSQQRASIPCVFNLVVCKDKYADCSLRKNGLFELVLPEKVPEA